MSFSVDLWNAYDLVYDHYTYRRKGLKDLIMMFEAKHDLDLEYAKGLKRIYDCNYNIGVEDTFLSGINAFKNDLLNQFNYICEFINSFREDIIEPLKKFAFEQENQSKKFNDAMRKSERDFRESVEKLERAKSKYHTSAKTAEEAKLSDELARLQVNLPKEIRDRNSLRSQTSLKEGKEAEKQYVIALSQANNFREIYIETMKKILIEFQILEENYIDFAKDCLRRYTIFQLSMIRNYQYDIDKKAKIFENIDAVGDINAFIENNKTKSLPPYRFEFVPYVSDLLTKNASEQYNIPQTIVSSVKNFMQNTFLAEDPGIESDPNENRANNDISTYLRLSWEGKGINIEERKNFVRYMKEKRNRKFLLTTLNKYRVSGNFNLDEKAFVMIGKLLLDLLDDLFAEKDYDSTKFLILLTQTFYRTASEPNKPRIFLQSLIENDQNWKNIEFWEGMMRYSINDEMLNQQNYNVYSFETQSDKQRRILGIVQSQLTSFIYNMLSFDVNKEQVKGLIEKFSNYYQVSQESVQALLKILEDYSNSLKSDSKVEIKQEKTSKNKQIDSEFERSSIKTLIDETLKIHSEKNSKNENSLITEKETKSPHSNNLNSEEIDKYNEMKENVLVNTNEVEKSKSDDSNKNE